MEYFVILNSSYHLRQNDKSRDFQENHFRIFQVKEKPLFFGFLFDFSFIDRHTKKTFLSGKLREKGSKSFVCLQLNEWGGGGLRKDIKNVGNL